MFSQGRTEKEQSNTMKQASSKYFLIIKANTYIIVISIFKTKLRKRYFINLRFLGKYIKYLNIYNTTNRLLG